MTWIMPKVTRSNFSTVSLTENIMLFLTLFATRSIFVFSIVVVFVLEIGSLYLEVIFLLGEQ